MNRERRTALVAMLFLLPNFAGFAVFMLGPVLFSLVAAFTNWTLVKDVPFRFVGIANFQELLGRQEFWMSAINTAYLMLGMPVSIAGSLFLAVLLSERIRGATIYRTLFYLPSFTSGAAVFILWKKLYNPEYGPVNTALRAGADAAGMEGFTGPQWLASTQNLLGLDALDIGFSWGQWGLGARDALIIMGLWMTIGGSNMLLYIAGISNIPQELYEAADIDGAGRWRRFVHVTWPQLAPTTFFIVIMSFIAGLQGGFEQARVMTDGGPANTTVTLAFHIYHKAFMEFRIGYASAVAWILFTIIFGITLLNWRFGARHGND